MLEKNKDAIMNEQSRDTGNIGYTICQSHWLMIECTFTLSNFVPTSYILFTLIRDSVKLFLKPRARTLVYINEPVIGIK
jgi:hypothetical protein